MEEQFFIIKAKLPSLNEYIDACRNNKFVGAKFKENIENVIGYEILNAKSKRMLKPTDKPCKIVFEWHERTRKRDCDNIASAKKFILDALQKQGIIKNDNQKYIRGFTDEFYKSQWDYVVVRLQVLEGE